MSAPQYPVSSVRVLALTVDGETPDTANEIAKHLTYCTSQFGFRLMRSSELAFSLDYTQTERVVAVDSILLYAGLNITSLLKY